MNIWRKMLKKQNHSVIKRMLLDIPSIYRKVGHTLQSYELFKKVFCGFNGKRTHPGHFTVIRIPISHENFNESLIEYFPCNFGDSSHGGTPVGSFTRKFVVLLPSPFRKLGILTQSISKYIFCSTSSRL